MAGYKKGCGHGKKGYYKNIWCDSSWELAYVIYNLEHNIKFERNKQFFNYEYKGKTRKYYPDFKLDDKNFVEIKGFKTELDKVKFEQFPKNLTLIVLEANDLKEILFYVKEKYGNDFIKLYEK